MIQAAPKPCGIVARPAKKAMPAAPRLAAAVTPAPQRASAAKSSPAVLPPGPVLQAAKGEPVPDDEHAVKDELPSDDEQAHPVAAGMDGSGSDDGMQGLEAAGAVCEGSESESEGHFYEDSELGIRVEASLAPVDGVAASLAHTCWSS